jgi:hypothetical protein
MLEYARESCVKIESIVMGGTPLDTSHPIYVAHTFNAFDGAAPLALRPLEERSLPSLDEWWAIREHAPGLHPLLLAAFSSTATDDDLCKLIEADRLVSVPTTQ